jgi:hypothetical protein
MLSVIMLSANMLNVIMLSVTILNGIILNVVMLSVVMLNVMAPLGNDDKLIVRSFENTNPCPMINYFKKRAGTTHPFAVPVSSGPLWYSP